MVFIYSVTISFYRSVASKNKFFQNCCGLTIKLYIYIKYCYNEAIYFVNDLWDRRKRDEKIRKRDQPTVETGLPGPGCNPGGGHILNVNHNVASYAEVRVLHFK